MTLFGKKGIDTSYERDLFERRVKLEYPEKEGYLWLPSDIMEDIQRAREFSISNVISGYENLLERVEVLMQYIESIMSDDADFYKLIEILNTSGYKAEAIDLENAHGYVRSNANFEIYTVLFRLRDSMSKQLDFQYDFYASQFIVGRSLEDLEIAESNSISVLAQLQSSLYTGHSHSDDHDNTEIVDDESSIQDIIQQTSVMHITNGDVSFSHLNRQADLKEIITYAENLVYFSKEMIGGNIELMIQKIYALKNKGAVKAQLLAQFYNIRSKHNSSKNKYMSVTSDVELYASEASYANKKIKENSTEPIMSWLISQEEGESEAFDQLANILSDGVVNSERNYENMQGSLTQLYKSETNYFATQLDFIQEKEKIRLYFSIIEELEEKSSLDGEWVLEYLAREGYKSSADV